MKILITGATGRVGIKLINYLSNTYEVIGIDRNINNQIPNVKFYQADITNIEEIEDIIGNEKPDSIIHLAAILGPACETNEELAYEINVEATENLVKLAIKHNIQKFIFASTSAVYNQKELEPTSEIQNVNPQSIYGKTKLKAEILINDLMKSETATKCIILRMFNIYGNEFTESLISKLINSTAESPITVVGPKNFIRDYIHIDQVTKAFELALKANLDNKIEVFNIGSGKAINNEELINIVGNVVSKIYYTIKPCELNVSWANIDKSKTLLKFNPEVKILI